MSEPLPPLRLPARPSLEQLRNQAKDLLRAARNGDAAALQRIRSVLPNAHGYTLADAQFALARAYGLETWPKLVHHVNATLASARVEHFEQLAQDLLDAWNGGAAGLERLSELFGRPLSPDEVRELVKRGFAGAVLTHDEARKQVARLYGFDSWEKLVESLAQQPDDPRKAAFGMSTTPPFYTIDWKEGQIAPRGPISDKDWDAIFAVMREHRLHALDASGQMSDKVMERLTKLDFVTSLRLSGSNRLSDAGLRHLARAPQLQALELGGSHSRITDQGLEVLQHLPALRKFAAWWTRSISDAGVANLTFCDNLVDVDLLGTPTGDGAINALTGKRHLQKFKSGRLVTNAGVALLQRFPVFADAQQEAARYDMMDFLAGPVSLLLDGSVTAEGLTHLTRLQGLHALSFFGNTPGLRGHDLAALRDMTQLAMLGCDGALCDDYAMSHIAAMPGLRMLMAQGTVASDRGFTALSKSRTIEYIWGRECPNLGSRGFVALASMPALEGLAVSCKNVDDAALSILPQFPCLTALVSMDVPDEGFRHIGACAALERLWCMYCRDTGDRATEHIANLTNLRMYYAGATQITDGSLATLARMASLEEIEFWEVARITNAGVEALASLPRLRQLTISGLPNVSREAFNTFPARVRVSYW